MGGRRLVVAAVVAASLVGSTGSAGASPAASVVGSGWVTLPAEYGDFAGDPVLFQVHADGGRAAPGRFNVVHLDKDGGVYAHAVGDVTCVSVSDGVAVTTGIIRHGWIRDEPADLVGMAAAITVQDAGGADSIGFDFEFFGSTIAPCGEVTPWSPVDRGNYVVR